ncbi:hypothetical protein FRC12_023839 [Ceratobasidium sp. 428]|nr:hypothetical protein FRC12_023839 [Ceratobasidium sp. 428]
MEPTIEDKSIKPVNKLRERFEALAASSSSTKSSVSPSGQDQDEEFHTTQEATNASPRLTGLYNLRVVSTSSSSIPNTSIVLKKSSESDTSNEEVPTPVHEVPTQLRSVSPSIGRKPGLKPPPPPPPPDRAGSLRNKTSTDSVGSLKKAPPLGVYRKPPPPPPQFLGSQSGHAASLSVGDLVNQINVGNGPSFRSLDTS